MIVEEVLTAVVAALRADVDLMSVLGNDATRIGPVIEDEERPIDSVRYQTVLDVEEEVMNPLVIQLDFWARNQAVALIIEKRLRKVLHHDTRRTFGGLEMMTQYEESRELEDPKPGVMHKSLDFRFEPVKRR